MKKMIPVYVILLAMLGTFIFVSYKVLRKLDYMNAQIVSMQEDRAQNSSISGEVFEVEVVNTPSVTVTGSVDVDVSEPLRVKVANEPLEVSIH